MLAQDVQHVVFVAQQDRHPCRGGALGQPYGALETAARKVEDVPLLALFFEHRERQRERGHVGDVRHVSRVQIVFLGSHVDYGDVQRAEDALDRRQCVGVAALRFAQYGVAAREGPVLRGPRPAGLGAPHRMRRHETAAPRVHRDHLAQLGLDRPHVHHHLPVSHMVERFYGHQRNRVDGCRQHHEIGLRNALFERHDAVGQSEPEGFGGVFVRLLDA